MKYLSYFIVSSVFVALVAAHGVPMLRHDWLVAPTRSSFLAIEYEQFFGWSCSGIGTPRILPSDYLEQIPVTVSGLLFGSLPTLCLVLFACAAYVFAAIEALSRPLSIPVFLRVALGAIFLFNTWSYNCVVAGHLTMLVSAAGLLGILAMAAIPRISQQWFPLWLFGVMLQFQLLLLALPVLAFVLFRSRDPRNAVLATIILLPVFVSPAFARDTIAAIPVSVDWERIQSVDLLQGLLLSGYAANYMSTQVPLAYAGAVFLALSAALSAFALLLPGRGAGRRRYVLLGLLLIAAAIFASGTNGPAGREEAWAFEHIRPFDVFRELYDIVGLILVCYVLIVAATAARNRVVAAGIVASACAFCAVWIMLPPVRYWPIASTIPRANPGCIPGARFALAPWPVPLTYRGQGSGLDPDALPACVGYVPFNVPLPGYPVDRALAEADAGNDRAMRYLGVSRYIVRNGFSTSNAVVDVLPTTARTKARLRLSDEGSHNAVRTFDPLPLITLQSVPSEGTLDDDVSRGGIFYADVQHVALRSRVAAWRGGAFIPIRGAERLDDSVMWIDANRYFAKFPLLSQGIGGAETTSSTLLPVPNSAPDALGIVWGRLMDERGHVIVTSVKSYSWFNLHGARAVRCAGRCIIAAFGNPPAGIPLNPPRAQTIVIPQRELLPFLYEADVPQHGTVAVRFNQSYADTWHAVAMSMAQPAIHFPIDRSVNGWLLPPSKGGRLWIFDPGAALLVLLEVCGIVAAVLLIANPGCLTNREEGSKPI